MSNYTCPMCGASMTVRDTANGQVIDCDNDNQECNYQVDKGSDEDGGHTRRSQAEVKLQPRVW